MNLLICFGTIASLTAAAFGITCFTCEEAVSNQNCQEIGKLTECKFGKVCLNEVRRDGDGTRINKRCKQPLACRNNHFQNMNGEQTAAYQCNIRKLNFVCRCCCDSNRCNAASLFCIEGYPDDTAFPIFDDGRIRRLSLREIAILRKSWSTLTSFGLETVGLLSLLRLFDVYPQTRRLFPSFNVGDNKKLTLEQLQENQRIVLHAESVANAFDNIIGLLEEEEELVLLLLRLGATHAAHGVAPHHFDFMGTAFLDTMQDILSENDNSRTMRVWRKAYEIFKINIVSSLEEYVESGIFENFENNF